ncbi:hypothetical protein MMSR116_19250 [Methylobacterium mesophilicum SR1.6/6]|uniref:Uncharacterized protein n=1 Tax=Methylobacterium mesophilicum SR1.6/6 TaxID=908290 RepID=A0A6B9FME1_9HYPH|nr:hypothetical protein MMSR116_19250 [Methylobacterium mesophilicum SR1.6/6]
MRRRAIRAPSAWPRWTESLFDLHSPRPEVLRSSLTGGLRASRRSPEGSFEARPALRHLRMRVGTWIPVAVVGTAASIRRPWVRSAGGPSRRSGRAS